MCLSRKTICYSVLNAGATRGSNCPFYKKKDLMIKSWITVLSECLFRNYWDSNFAYVTAAGLSCPMPNFVLMWWPLFIMNCIKVSKDYSSTQIAKFMGPTWGPPGSCRPQMGPMLAPWTLLSGHKLFVKWIPDAAIWEITVVPRATRAINAVYQKLPFLWVSENILLFI